MSSIIIQSKSALINGAYTGTLLDPVRAAEDVIGRSPHWFINQEPVAIKEAGSYGFTGPHINDPFQALVDSFTQNIVWMYLSASHVQCDEKKFSLASTARFATLRSFPVDVNLNCRLCIQSPDFHANLDWAIDSLSNSAGILSIRDEILARANVTSVEGKLLPVSMHINNVLEIGGLMVTKRCGEFFSGTLHIASERESSEIYSCLSDVELIRRIDYANKREHSSTEFVIARIL